MNRRLMMKERCSQSSLSLFVSSYFRFCTLDIYFKLGTQLIGSAAELTPQRNNTSLTWRGFSLGSKCVLVLSSLSVLLNKSHNLWHRASFITTAALCAVSQQHHLHYRAFSLRTHCTALQERLSAPRSQKQ